MRQNLLLSYSYRWGSNPLARKSGEVILPNYLIVTKIIMSLQMKYLIIVLKLFILQTIVFH